MGKTFLSKMKELGNKIPTIKAQSVRGIEEHGPIYSVAQIFGLPRRR
jgi:hypothetical protein